MRTTPWLPLAATTLFVATQWTACGGKAIVDGGSAAGGSGGTSNHSSSSGALVAPASSSSGMSCSCTVACNDLQNCGFFGPECLTLCQQSNDPEFFSCVCGSQGSCGTISACGIGTTGVTAVSSSGTGGGGLTPMCVNCMQNQAENGACTMQFDACVSNPGCENLINCAADCNFVQGCIEQCEATYPGGAMGAQLAMSCLLCGTCFSTCASSYASQYYCATF
jgi:hypothetical protein